MAGKFPRGIENHHGKIRITVRHNGSVYKEVLLGSPLNARDIASAVKERAEVERRIKLGLSPRQGQDGGTLILFKDAAAAYIEALKARNSKSSHVDESALIIDRYWLGPFAYIPVSEISTNLILKELGKMGVKAKTKLNRVGPLSGVLELHRVNPNPVHALGIKKDQRDPIERYAPIERAALLNTLSGQARVYFALLFGGGLRPGEALGLRWTDYNGKRLVVAKQITKRKQVASTKTRFKRDVILPTWTREILNEHTTRFAGGHIFLNESGEPYKDTDVFNGFWQKAHVKARIPYRIPYTCRHTRAAELLSQGIEPGDAARYMGHSVEMFFRTYGEWIAEYTKEKKLDSRFEGVGLTLRAAEETPDWGDLGQKTPRKHPENEVEIEGPLISKGIIGDPDGTRTR